MNESKSSEKKSAKGGKYENLILEEDRKKGQVELSIYKDYFKKSGGWYFFIPFVLALGIQQGMRVMSNIWMSIWVNQSNPDYQTFNMIVYTCLSVGYIFWVTIRASILYYASFISARRIHQNMVSSLLFAPLNEFFDRIPLGRILNRFTKDIDVIDNDIHWAYNFLSMAIFNIINTTVMNMYTTSFYTCFLIAGYLFICSRI